MISSEHFGGLCLLIFPHRFEVPNGSSDKCFLGVNRITNGIEVEVYVDSHFTGRPAIVSYCSIHDFRLVLADNC